MNKESLQVVGTEVVKRIPDNHGFILLTFPFGEDPRNRCNYVSNADRMDAINAMKEFIIKCGAEEDWMKDLP